MTQLTVKALIAVLLAYVAGIVVCFGPATVQSEAAKKEFIAECLARQDQLNKSWCYIGGPSSADGVAKAVFWPFWLSYTVAKEQTK